MNKYSELEIMLEKERLRVEMMHKELIKDMDKMSVYQKENERLKQKVNQLETNRDDAIELLTKGFNFCENDSQGEIDICNIAINREKKAIEILRRGKE